jgi:hypothetical protein
MPSVGPAFSGHVVSGKLESQRQHATEPSPIEGRPWLTLHHL